VVRVLTSSREGLVELLAKRLCPSPSSILALFGEGYRGWRHESTFLSPAEEARFPPLHDDFLKELKFVTCSWE
jgi:hypothetical protein